MYKILKIEQIENVFRNSEKKMARSVEIKLLSSFLKQQDMTLSVVRPDAGEIEALNITQGSSFSGLVRGARTSAFEVERWVSNQARCRGVWDCTIVEHDGDIWDEQHQFNDMMRSKCSDCVLPPGTAYRLTRVEEYNLETLKYEPILPRKRPDGAYAFEVHVPLIARPDAWISAAEKAGFIVRKDVDKRMIFGSRFPGGAENYAPPMDLIPFPQVLKTAEEMRAMVKKPARSGSEKREAATGAIPKTKIKARSLVGKHNDQDRSPGPKKELGKVWAVIPAHPSCESLIVPFAKRTERASESIRNAPSAIRKKAAYADNKTPGMVLRKLKKFVESWDPEASGMPYPNIPIFMRKLKSLAKTESVYCKLFIMLNSQFKFEWDKPYTVMTNDQARELLEAEIGSCDSDDSDCSDCSSLGGGDDSEVYYSESDEQ